MPKDDSYDRFNESATPPWQGSRPRGSRSSDDPPQPGRLSSWRRPLLVALVLTILAILARETRFRYIAVSAENMYVRDRWTGELKFCHGSLCSHVQDVEQPIFPR